MSDKNSNLNLKEDKYQKSTGACCDCDEAGTGTGR